MKYSHYLQSAFPFLALIFMLNFFYQTEVFGQDLISETIYGYKLKDNKIGDSIDKTNVYQSTINYLRLNQDRFNVDTESIYLKKLYYSLGKYYLRFGQKFLDLPVYGGHVGLKIKDGKIVLMSIKFYRNIPLEQNPTISQESAIQLAKNLFGSFSDTQIRKKELVIYPIERGSDVTYKLAWRIELFSANPVKGEIIFIDGMDGYALNRIESICYSISGTVQGRIWEESYFDYYEGARNVQPQITADFEHQTVELTGTPYDDNTNSSGEWSIHQGGQNDTIYSTLIGPYVLIKNNKSSAINTDEHSSTTEYSWTWDDTSDHADEYNVFYHINLIHDYLDDNFGYEWSWNGRNPSTQMWAYVNYNSTAAWYDRFDRKIFFGSKKDSGETTQRYKARCSDVIYHEYFHAVNHDIGTRKNLAIDEGFCDYFACTIVGESLYGEGYHAGRELYDNPTFYYFPDDMTTYPNQSNHNDGTIIAGGAWDLRVALGATTADELIFEGLKTLGIRATPHSFSDLVNCILYADDENNGDSNPNTGTPNQADILEAFGNHHIYPSGYVFSGTMRKKVDTLKITWEDDIVLTDDVTVNGKIELTIASGNTVKVKPDKKLTIRGTLGANDVSFQSTSISDEWSGLVFDSDSCSS